MEYGDLSNLVDLRSLKNQLMHGHDVPSLKTYATWKKDPELFQAIENNEQTLT